MSKCWRHGLGEIAADQQDGVRAGDVGERERQPTVETEGAQPRGRGRRHAEPPVVVDHRRPQHDPGELAQGVGLLIRQPAAPVHRDRIRAGLGLRGADPVRDDVQGLVPRGGVQIGGTGAGTSQQSASHQGSQQAIRYPKDLRCRPPLLAQPTAVGRELAGLDGDRGRILAPGIQGRRALQGAVRAVGRGPGASGWERTGGAGGGGCGHGSVRQLRPRARPRARDAGTPTRSRRT